jgi:hypothetical protein
MDIYQIRRQNLIALIEREYSGNQTTFAQTIGIKPPQINRWLSETAGEKRRINENSARRIEEKSGKPAGWLDVADLIGTSKAPGAVNGGMFQLVTQAWKLADDLEKAVMIAWAHAVISKNER